MLYKRWKGRLLLFLAVFFAAVLFFSQAAAAGRIKDKVLRLHVIANSDSEEDQALKLKVRDQVLATLKPLLENAEDRSSSEAIVRAHLSEVEAAARETAWQEKPGENVHAELTNTRFPEKTYGDCTFPAGNYDDRRGERKKLVVRAFSESLFCGHGPRRRARGVQRAPEKCADGGRVREPFHPGKKRV